MSQTWLKSWVLPASVVGNRSLVLVLALALPSQQGTLGKLLTLLGPLFHLLWLLVPPAQEPEVLGRHSLCWPSYSPCNYQFCSSSLNIRHSGTGKRVPWALLRGGPRAELASLTAPFSSFSSPCHPRSCPSSWGGSQRPGDGICIVLGRFPGELWAPLPSWVPAICLLLGLFWRSSPKALAVEARAHRIAPTPRESTGA